MLELLGPDDAGYDLQRKTFNAVVDAKPAAIARCASREDVIAALALAAERGLPVAVRGAGTSELSTVEGGVVIDLAELDTIEIDLPSRTASVGGGVTWADLDEATQEHGLAVTGARLSGLGVVGVALLVLYDFRKSLSASKLDVASGVAVDCLPNDRRNCLSPSISLLANCTPSAFLKV